MSDLVTRMDIALHNRVQSFQDTINKFKRKTKAEVHELEDEFYDKIQDIEDVLEDGRERIAKASETIDDMALETLNNIQVWRKRREIKKLAKEAEKSRHYAEAAVDVAIGALDEAEWAITRAYVTKEFAGNLAEENAA